MKKLQFYSTTERRHIWSKLIFLAILSLLTLSTFAQPSINLPEESASVTFTNPVSSSNMWLVVDNNKGAEAYTEAATIDGVQCRKIPAGKFLYARINKSAVPTSQTNILIAVTYYANSNNSLWFNYNSKTNNYSIADFGKTNSGQWVTTIVSITDAALKGAMNGGSDIRMGYNNEDNYIKEIFVYKAELAPDAQPIPEKPNSPDSEFIGKSFAGYQIWHKAGPNAADWSHWAYGKIPAAGFLKNVYIQSFPDLSEIPYEDTYPTKFANLGNGAETRLYNAPDSNIINRQMKWLEDVDFDGVAVQRFVGGIGKSVTISPTSHLSNVKKACEATGRLFYICYDLNGADASIVNSIKTDWVYEIEQIRSLTSSPAYATVNGKPVVEIWGIGMDKATVEQNKGMIDFLHSRGCYVVGGTKREWRGEPQGYAAVYDSLDCISPWTVGAYNNISGANNYLNKMKADKAYCDQHGIDYLPVVFAGSGNWLSSNGSFSQTDREGGMLLWTQIRNAKSIGCPSVYYAMLDEFEENTNLINAAVDYFDIPTDQYFETLAKDGIWTSSDYYLRLGAITSKLLRGEIPETDTIPIPYSLGPIYYRNSFESRSTTFTMNGATTTKVLTIDPCFYKPRGISRSNVSPASVKIVNEPEYSRDGNYSAKISGSANSTSSASYYYKIAETKIPVKADMQIHFWKYTVDELGKYSNVDLLFASGKVLHDLPGYTDQNGSSMHPNVARGNIGEWSNYVCQIGKDELIGEVITGIIIGFDHPAESETFNAYFDNIIIEDTRDIQVSAVSIPHSTESETDFILYPNPASSLLSISFKEPTVSKTQISLYQINGKLVKLVVVEKGILDELIDIKDLTSGVYFLQVTNSAIKSTKKVLIK